MKLEILVKKILTAWQNKDWKFVESILATNFTFTSPYDDHIDIPEYKKRCWDKTKDFKRETFEIISLMEKENEVFVRYKGNINGSPVHNTEYFKFHNGKLEEISVFFGRP